NHRTDSIDYATVISGEIDMELDGTSVHLKAGDLLVQRGTIHNWVNKGTAPCVIAFVLVGAKPVTAGGKVLNAGGGHEPTLNDPRNVANVRNFDAPPAQAGRGALGRADEVIE